ncbi:serine hydrolase [Sphingomonas bacterium]|uniref:serine hydrolase domain-containing protein n=1 Tax=Sphingomonas bacterium TaxID=1895847 RepID=UPI00260C53AC|nr:serine hydrolase domain-containing protein [Sphingomonas bacterium]
MLRPLLASLALLATPAVAQPLTPAELARVDKVVTETLRETGVPSASVAIVRGGRIVLAKAWGKQCERCNAPDPNLPQPIASVSKQFTTAALLLLENEGKLSLDDPVARHLPGVTGGERITIRQLLSHTAGLQDYWPQDYSFAAMERPIAPRGIVERWAGKPLDFAPGAQWQYSNTGYTVAGMIAEKAAGQPLMAFMHERLFRPLGIRAVDHDLAVGRGFAQGYERHALGPVRVAQLPASGWMYATGHLAMSAADLARWNIARLNRALLPAEDWAEQEKVVPLSDGTDTGYALGVFSTKRDGRRFVGHDGAAVGFLTQNFVYPDDKVAITVIINGDFSNAASAIAAGLTGIVLPASAATADDGAMTARARGMFDSLVAGAPNRAALTENARYFFKPVTLADYRTSLSALGRPVGFELARPARLRGGFVNRNYVVTYPTRRLRIITYTEPGPNGRYEQFIVQPAS